MMWTYIYDGSFEGLLTAIYEAFHNREKPQEIVAEREFLPRLFVYEHFIERDPTKAERVYSAIRTKISCDAQRYIYLNYLSCYPEKGNWIYRYLRLGFKKGKNINLYLSQPDVLQIHKTARQVQLERHRLCGLVRFRKLTRDIYYASIEPDHNVLALIAPHFVHRFADQNWIIHDLKRNLAAVYNQQDWLITDFHLTDSLNMSGEEKSFQDLWREYFRNISITERKNPRLQRQYMPRRYWNHLTEKE